MSRKHAKTLLLLITLIIYGCKKEEGPKFLPITREENLKGIIGVVITDKELVVLDLEKNNVIERIKPKIHLNDLLYNDSLYLLDDAVWLFNPITRSTKKIVELPHEHKQVVKLGEQFFALIDDGVVNLLDKSKASIDEGGIKLLRSLREETLYSLDKRGLKIISSDLKEVRRVEFDNPLDFIITPYGIRAYILGKRYLQVIDTQELSVITRIQLKGEPKKLAMTPAGNKIYCIVGNPPSIAVIKRLTNKVVKEIKLNDAPKDIHISRDGSFGIIILSDKCLLLDAGLDDIVEELQVSPIDVATSPKDSRIYFLTTDEVIVVRTKDLVIEGRIKIEGGKRIFVYPESIESIPTEVPKVSKEGVASPDTFFTIQVSSGRSLKGAESLVSLLRASYYPAYIIREDNWYRVRVGAFRDREDSEAIADRISRLIDSRAWITKEGLNLSLIPELPTRDVNDNGLLDEAYQVDNKRIVVLEMHDKVYEKIYTVQRDTETYAGDPVFEDVDGDGNPEIVISTVTAGMYSIIDFENNEFTERIERR